MSRWRLLDAVLGRLTFCTCTHPGRRLTRPSVGLRGGPVRCLKIVTTSWVYRFSSRCSARSSRPTSQGGHLGPKGARAPRSRAFKVCSVRIYYKSQESAANGSRNKPLIHLLIQRIKHAVNAKSRFWISPRNRVDFGAKSKIEIFARNRGQKLDFGFRFEIEFLSSISG